MPTILRFRGLRVMIYSYDHRPPHVHVIGPGAEARIALGEEGEQPWVITNDGLSRRHVVEALAEIEGESRSPDTAMERDSWRCLSG
jgi:Domain of unknown function (DUF4160)